VALDGVSWGWAKTETALNRKKNHHNARHRSEAELQAVSLAGSFGVRPRNLLCPKRARLIQSGTDEALLVLHHFK